MTSASNLEYQVQNVIPDVVGSSGRTGQAVHALCVQALGSEIYVGCSNGELLRFALQADSPDVIESYRLLSRQTIPNHKPIDEIVLIPSILRAMILSDRQIHFYTLPSLDPIPLNAAKKIRNVVTFAVDHQHLRRPPPSFSGPHTAIEPVDFCLVKRTGLGLFSLREKLSFLRDIPLPQGVSLVRRTGRYLCVADKENYNVIDLETAFLSPVLPISQAPSPTPVKPLITVVSDNEFLVLSSTGSTTLGVFINGDGDPVRAPLEWSSHPEDVCLDYPYMATLLQDASIQIHNIETQSIVQVIPPPTSPEPLTERIRLAGCLNGYFVPSNQKTDKLRMTSVPLRRREKQENVDV